ncbi:MAG: hypothetical protein LDLANPLL_01585 [Turneriella sp.]|nr:hypothetical protein [Turneriella sp.]
MVYRRPKKQRVRWLIIPLSLLTMFPSEPPEACTGKSNPNLLRQFTTSTLENLMSYTEDDAWHKEGSWENWASSTLKADGSAPKAPKGTNQGENRFPENFTWSCMYCVASLFDKRTDTAWSEAIDGDGVGQIALIPVKYFSKGKRKSATLKIFNGFGRSKRIWQNNNRVKEMVLHIASAKAAGVEYWTNYSSIEHKCKIPVTLKDHYGYQTIPIPLSRCNWNVQFSQEEYDMGAGLTESLIIGLEIVSVYPGEKYKDTLISEVDFY